MKVMKKLLAVMLSLCLVIPTTDVRAVEVFSDAVDCVLNTEMEGSFTATGEDPHYYKFTLGSAGSINISGSFSLSQVYVHLMNEEGTSFYDKELQAEDNGTSIVYQKATYLNAGTYYFCVAQDSNAIGSYRFTITYAPVTETYPESQSGSNNSMQDASSIYPDQAYDGVISETDEKDYYCINLYPGTYQVRVGGDMEWLYMYFYDSEEGELASGNPRKDSSLGSLDYISDEIIVEEQADYYLCFQRDREYTGTYSFYVHYLTEDELPTPEPEETEDPGEVVSPTPEPEVTQTPFTTETPFPTETAPGSPNPSAPVETPVPSNTPTVTPTNAPTTNPSSNPSTYTTMMPVYTLPPRATVAPMPTTQPSAKKAKLSLSVTAKKGKKAISVKTKSRAKVTITFQKPKNQKKITNTVNATGKKTIKLKFKLKKGYKFKVQATKSGYQSVSKTVKVK